jgi:hypothetical protein
LDSLNVIVGSFPVVYQDERGVVNWYEGEAGTVECLVLEISVKVVGRQIGCGQHAIGNPLAQEDDNSRLERGDLQLEVFVAVEHFWLAGVTKLSVA